MLRLAGARPAHAWPVRAEPLSMLRSPGARFFLVAFCMQLAVRWVLIDTYPNNYSMDAYQRWGGREHLLIQGWLPVTQFFVWLTATLGGGILAMRVVMAIVGALAVAAGGWTARLMAGPAAGWLFMPIGLFGPFLTWSVVPYQEGTFLLVLFGGLGLALRAQAQPESTRRQAWLIADVAAGLLPLVRYEGWPVTLLYILWRRQPQAWVASWGAWLWIIIKLMGVQSNASSPIDYADWEGLDTRFDPAVLQASLSKMWKQMLDTKGAFVLMTGLVAWIHLVDILAGSGDLGSVGGLGRLAHWPGDRHLPHASGSRCAVRSVRCLQRRSAVAPSQSRWTVYHRVVGSFCCRVIHPTRVQQLQTLHTLGPLGITLGRNDE